jgi:SRSO17 transposase
MQTSTDLRAGQQLKEELDLDHFEGRSWQGLHLHALMTMMAYVFLQYRRLKTARREKKIQRAAAATDIAPARQARPSSNSPLPPPQRCPRCQSSARLR